MSRQITGIVDRIICYSAVNQPNLTFQVGMVDGNGAKGPGDGRDDLMLQILLASKCYNRRVLISVDDNEFIVTVEMPPS